MLLYKNCETCGVEFQKQKTTSLKDWIRRRFCSLRCNKGSKHRIVKIPAICELCERVYLANKNRYRPRWCSSVCRNRSVAKKLRGYLAYKKNRPCTDCFDQFEPCQMDFDHIRGEKSFNLASMVGKGCISMARVDEEISKCEVVCANCHRLRTVKRLHKEVI